MPAANLAIDRTGVQLVGLSDPVSDHMRQGVSILYDSGPPGRVDEVRMPQTVVAQDGDTLCGLAIRHGFLNCDPLRAEGANSALTSRALVAGDRVTIPDIRKKKAPGATGGSHSFKLERRPEPSLRFVHGTKSRPFAQDPTLTKLNISNYRTDRAGTTAQAAFSNAFGFQQDAHDDPDTFKLELISPDGGTPKIKLEALQPSYRANGTVSGHAPFTGANAAGRSLTLDTQAAGTTGFRYRTRYLRLVTDTLDQAAAATQALLVSDIADGNGGANDQMEILDQNVRASYELPKCNAGSKCTLVAELPVGENKRRIRMSVTILRTTPGGPAIGGTTTQMVRRRIFKWFRRAYAQTNMAPKLIGNINTVDPPSADMIAISDPNGTPASGVDATGSPSTLTFRLDRPPLPFFGNILPAHTITVNLVAGRTPAQVCADIVAALPGGFAGTVYTNAQATNRATPSADVIITRADGNRVMIRSEATTDTALTIGVARVNVANVPHSAGPFAALLVSTPVARRVLRISGADNRLDFFVVGSLPGARGVAFIPATDLAVQYRPPRLCRWSILMRAAMMNGADNDPFTFPHEAGHVLNDAFHADNADPNVGTELMTGTGTSAANAAGGSKRVSDDPVQVQYQKYDPAQGTPGAWHSVNIQPTQRFRTRGAPVTEGW